MKKRFYLLALSVILFGCKKQDNDSVIRVDSSQKTTGGPIPSYNFDWENTTYLPSASTSVNQVPMPWNSGTTAIDVNVAFDYKRVDGWELVYNSFSPTVYLNDPNYTYFFALYNKYRGLLRFYLWHPSSSNATDFATHKLSLYGNNVVSNMLQFNGNENIDILNLDQNGYNVIQQQPINSSGGTWYAFQYEMAYDPTIATSTFPSTGLTWNSGWSSITSFNLLGSTTGTLKGTIGAPSTGFNFGSFLTKSAINFVGEYGYNAYLGAFIGEQQALTNLNNTITNARNGVVKGLLNGILGIGGTAPQPISLTLNTETKITGNSVTNGGMVNMKLILPGQQNSLTADGLTPSYNNVMGLFKLQSKPIVHMSAQTYTVYDDDPIYAGAVEYEDLHLSLDQNSIQFIWNPAIVNSSFSGVTISNIRKQVILMDGDFQENAGNSISEIGALNYGSVLVFSNSSVENYLRSKIAVGPINTNSPLKIGYRSGTVGWDSNQHFGVRISFDVISNTDNLKKTTIVKTFKPQIIW